jgi:uncharacterized membrane protein YfcA
VLIALAGAVAIGLSLGLLGSGGSILTVPVLHYLLGQPEKLAIGGSLLVVGLIAVAAAVPYALSRQVDWRNVAWFGFPGMVGAWLGATLAHWVPGPVQLALFSLVMLVAAWRMLRGGVTQRPDHEPRRLAVVAGGLGVGALSGLVGVGGGFLIVPALSGVLGLPLAAATATSLAVIALNTASAGAGWIGRVSLDLPLTLQITVAALAGMGLGTYLAPHIAARTLTRAFAILLLVLATFLIATELRR